jgi:biopolymer transport protein ExbD
MPKVKIPRKSTWQDMTAMCDVAFLLLTFFMLTSNFTQKEPVQIAAPTSTSEIKIPETNIMMILIDKSGKVFFGIDGQDKRIEMLKKMGSIYGITFTKEELKEFSLVNNFGVPIQGMKTYLSWDQARRDLKENQAGIPCDSANNQFKNWVSSAVYANSKINIAIKGDRGAQYKVIKQLMNTLQDLRQNRYNLITGLKEVPDNL